MYKFTLDGCGPKLDERELDHPAPAVLPKLTILVLGDFKCAYANYVLSQISAPNVRDLTLMNLTGEDYTAMAVKMTGRFPDVQLLTLYTVHMGDLPQTRKHVITWLHSMPKLRYLRIAALKPHMLHIFSQDPRIYGVRLNTPSPDPGMPVILAPKLDILEYQNIDLNAVLAFGGGRRTIGVPLKKIYINSPFHYEIDQEGQTKLRSIAKLYIAPPGADTQEELEILAA
jgi:hypothetical protein